MYEKVEEISKAFITTDFPLNIAIEPGNYCNLNCVMCAHDKLTRKKGSMSVKLYKKIIDEIALINPFTRIWLDYYGEPLIHKFKLYYFIDYARKKGLKNICLNTNATLLTEEMGFMLLDSGINFISIDCDGFSSEVYEKIRVKAKRDEVYKNIEDFLALRSEYLSDNKTVPLVEVKIMEMEQNKSEIQMVMDYWRRRGAWTTKRRLISWAGNIDDVKFSSNDFRQPCGHAIGIMAITWEGKVTNCVMDVDANFVCGDVNFESIEEVWKRRNITLVQKHLNREWDSLPEICSSCNDWKVIGEERFDENGNRILKSYSPTEEMLQP